MCFEDSVRYPGVESLVSWSSIDWNVSVVMPLIMLDARKGVREAERAGAKTRNLSIKFQRSVLSGYKIASAEK